MHQTHTQTTTATRRTVTLPTTFRFAWSDRPTRTVQYDHPMVVGRLAARQDMSKAGV